MGKDFPFGIADVCSLLDLTIRRRQANSMYADCPFCNNGKKGKLNINFAKNAYRCNYNPEHSGGMLDLYSEYHGISRSDAYREICEALRTEQQNPVAFARKKTIIPAPEKTVEIADLEVRHQTYSMLFTLLTLTSIHKKKLLDRGLTEEQIQHQGYRSTPAFGFVQLAAQLIEQGCQLEGVPGFYRLKDDEAKAGVQPKDGPWTINFNAGCSGIIIPVMSVDGRIQGAQIRLDRPFGDTKYIWLSSSEKYMGTSSGSPIHFVGNPHSEVVYITEGGLKGNISNGLTGKSFVCVAGISTAMHLDEPLQILIGLGLKKAVEAFDMDKDMSIICYSDYNEKCSCCESRSFRLDSQECDKKFKKRNDIRRGCTKVQEVCTRLNLPLERLTWDKDQRGEWAGHWKGIDDFQLAVQQRRKIHSG